MPTGENIDFDEACDGIFPFITNDMNMPLKEIMSNYKYEPHLEKRHEQLKSVYGFAQVMVKNVDGIEAFLFIYFIALSLESLMEREIRSSMNKVNKKTIRI